MPTDRSLLAVVEHRCPVGHVSQVRTWGVVDVTDRPDLARTLLAPDGFTASCATCGAKSQREAPLVLLFTTFRPALALVVSGIDGLPDEAPEWLPAWDDWDDAPFDVFAISRATALLATVRPLTADLAQRDAAHADVGATHNAEAVDGYRDLLERVDTAYHRAGVFAAFADVASCLTEGELEAALDRSAFLLEDEALAVLTEEHNRTDEPTLGSGIQLLHEARQDRRRAHAGHLQRMQRFGASLTEAVPAWAARIDEAGGTPETVIDVVTAALEWAAETAAPDDFVIPALEKRALAFSQANQIPRREAMRRSLLDAERAVSMTGDADEKLPDRLVNLAAIAAQQVDGDRCGNARDATGMLERAEALAADAGRPELSAWVQTNLARTVREAAPEGDLSAAERARELCVRALAWRSPRRDAEDWAYTQLVLGGAVETLSHAGSADIETAKAGYRQIIEMAHRIPRLLVGQARLQLLTVLGNEIDAAESNSSIQSAEEAAGLAIAVLDDRSLPDQTRGEAARRLGRVCRAAGDLDAAHEAWRTALPLLEQADLEASLRTIDDLAPLLCERDQWEEAAAVFGVGLSIADTLASGPVTLADRRSNMREIGRLHRWASFALARTGSPEDAVIALESGRARELRRQLQLESPELTELGELLPDLAEQWRTCLLVDAETGDRWTPAQSSRRQVLEAIRAVPGFEGFAGPPPLASIHRAARPRLPLVYVNPTPAGTSLLLVDPDGTVSGVELDVTSTEIVHRVQFGIDPGDVDRPIEELDPVSYIMLAASGPNENLRAAPGEFQRALDRLLPWLGERIAEPVASLPRARHDDGAVLVPTGPLATVPLAACPYGPEGVTLSDEFAVSVAPSASMHATALTRADDRAKPLQHLVAVADPTGDLGYAQAEVALASARFGAAHTATGSEATIEWLSQHAAQATTLHFACHGFSDWTDATNSGFVLAGGTELRSEQLKSLGVLNARLVVASACKTAVPDTGDLGEESASLGVALIGLGAACVVATLWSVNDLLTCVLMDRFYFELEGREPAQALASAQRWLRRQTPADIEAYLASHAELAAARREGGGPIPNPADSRQWAPFVVIGA